MPPRPLRAVKPKTTRQNEVKTMDVEIQSMPTKITKTSKPLRSSIEQMTCAIAYAEKHVKACAGELIALNNGTVLGPKSKLRKLATMCSWAPRQYGLSLAESLTVNAALKIVAGHTGHEDSSS